MRTRILIWLFFICPFSGQSQDIHFSQIHASPNQLNPANTGLFNSEFRIIANYKNQWKTATANYNTYFASLDGKIIYLPNKNFINAGVKVYSDKAGDLQFSKKQVNMSLSFVKSLSRSFENYLSLGLEGGFVNHSVDYTNVHTLDGEFDPSLNQTSSGFAFDLSGGATWYFKSRKWLVYSGAALYHINEPNIGFSDANGYQKLYRKEVLTSGAEFDLSSKILLMPSFVMFFQGPHQEVNIGSYVRHKIPSMDERNKRFIYYGAWFRWYTDLSVNTGTDAMIASVRLDNKNISYAFSYDFTVSSLSRTSSWVGSPEISIIYLIDGSIAGHINSNNKFRKITCPSF